MSSLKKLTAACMVIFALCSGAKAEDGSETGWKWRWAPISLWLIQFEGDTSGGDPDPPPDIDLSDIMDAVDGGLMANFEGIANNRWGFLVDINWIDVSGNQGQASLKFKHIQAEVDGFYRVPAGRGAIDWLLGVRYYSHDLELSPIPVSTSEEWVDPVIGVRWVMPFAQNWGLLLRGDIGGFGVGSDFAWQARAIVDWHPWKHWSIDTGLRAMAIDYETGSKSDHYRYDGTTWGPVIGFSLRW
jgi:hypothetical protein